MPTYEYECTLCGHAFETMHGMTEPVLRKCPRCGKLKLRRLISGGAGVIFKGSGFYETDYKRNRGGRDSAKTDSDKAEPAKADKPDAKPEKKQETTGGTPSAPKSDAKPKKDSGSKKD